MKGAVVGITGDFIATRLVNAIVNLQERRGEERNEVMEGVGRIVTGESRKRFSLVTISYFDLHVTIMDGKIFLQARLGWDTMIRAW